MSNCKVLNNGDTYKKIRTDINENFSLLEGKIEETNKTVSFDSLTEEQKASLKGEPGPKGDKGDKGDTGVAPIDDENIGVNTVWSSSKTANKIAEATTKLQDETRNMRVGDVGGKNLITYPYTHKSGNYKGVEITINDDDSISLNGTNNDDNGDFGFAGVSGISAIPYMVQLEEGKTYTLSLEFFSGSLPETSKVIINGWNDESYVRGLAACDNTTTSFTFTVDSGIKQGCIYLQNRAGHVFDNVRLRPILVEGTEVVPYERYVPSIKKLADEAYTQKKKLGSLAFSASGTTLSITDGINTWTLEANS